MVTAMLALAAMGTATVADQERTLYEQVFATPPKATNGFAEYVRAADALRANRAVRKLLAGEVDLTPLERNAQIAQEGKIALDLMRAGNRKPVEDPRAASLSLETVFPELASFKQLAKVAAADVAYRYAIGDSRGATDTFAEASKFVSRFVTMPTLIGALVMIACDAILLAPFEQNLARVALGDLERLERTAGERVASVAFLQRAMAAEGRLLEGIGTNEVAGFLEEDDEDEEADIARAMKARWEGLAPAQRAQVMEEVRGRARAQSARMVAVLAGPESTWRLAEPLSSARPSLVDHIVAVLSPIHEQALIAFAKNRTQWRLLRLHARIERFRLVQGRLPGRLDEATPADLAHDPWNDGPFEYKVVSLRDYDLTSKGDASTGPIAIRYRRQPPPEDGAAAPPPPSLLHNHAIRPARPG